jgi:hypothetical protein
VSILVCFWKIYKMLNDAGNISSMKNEQKSQSWEYVVVIRLIVSAEKVKDIVSLDQNNYTLIL